MNNKINEKKKIIIQKLSKLVKNFDYKHLDFLETYCDNYFVSHLEKYIEKCEEKLRIKIQSNSLSDEYLLKYCGNYSYNTTSGIYFSQTNDLFNYTSEDNISCDIYVKLQQLYPNMSTQHRIILKKLIMKKIKNNSYDDIIPESNTIQLIVNFLTPIIFENKIYSKYFLTFIGDLLLKKNKDYNEKCFILNCNDNFKLFLMKLNKYINLFFHNMNIFNHIKIKFYNHETKNSNILNMKHDVDMLYFNKDISFFITFLFICIYHSNKFENSINFLNQYQDNEETNYIRKLQTIKIEELIIEFWNDSIFEKQNSQLKEETILFLWKKFLKKNKLPKYLLFQQNMIDVFNSLYSKNINCEIQNNIYNNISSFNIPEIELFLDFWKNNIENDNDEKYLEIEEIQHFLKMNFKEKSCASHYKYFQNSNNILEIINHYFKDIKYENNKYIHHIKLKIWNKKDDISMFKKKYNGDTNNIDKLYNFYCKYKKMNQEKYTIVSKIYFTSYYEKV